jgi:hypothetical protein
LTSEQQNSELTLPAITHLPHGIQVVHDWDFPINKRATSLKTAFWLVAEAFFGRFKWFQKRLPLHVKNQKLSCALALLEIDRLFGVHAVWGLTMGVIERYPEFYEQLCKESEVRFHYHKRESKVGKGRWVPVLEVGKDNMVYDRRYSLFGVKDLPSDGECVVWHCDHPNNLASYIEFLKKCKEEGLL